MLGKWHQVFTHLLINCTILYNGVFRPVLSATSCVVPQICPCTQDVIGRLKPLQKWKVPMTSATACWRNIYRTSRVKGSVSILKARGPSQWCGSCSRFVTCCNKGETTVSRWGSTPHVENKSRLPGYICISIFLTSNIYHVRLWLNNTYN